VKRADIGVGIGLIILSAWVFWYANPYREKEIYIYGPNFFPQVLSILMGICGVILIIRAARGDVLPQTDRIDIRGFLRMVIAIGICIGYLFLMQVIGFKLHCGFGDRLGHLPLLPGNPLAHGDVRIHFLESRLYPADSREIVDGF